MSVYSSDLKKEKTGISVYIIHLILKIIVNVPFLINILSCPTLQLQNYMQKWIRRKTDN